MHNIVNINKFAKVLGGELLGGVKVFICCDLDSSWLNRLNPSRVRLNKTG